MTLRSCFTLPHVSFFFNDPPTTEIYTLSLHDALPIFERVKCVEVALGEVPQAAGGGLSVGGGERVGGTFCFSQGGLRERSEEHTSELQSHSDLVCRLLLEKKKTHEEETQVMGASRAQM